jgi:hypothetical protein
MTKKCALPFCKNEVHFQTKCALSQHYPTHPFSLRCNPATALKSINSKAVPKQTTHSFIVTSCTHIFQKFKKKPSYFPFMINQCSTVILSLSSTYCIVLLYNKFIYKYLFLFSSDQKIIKKT